MNAKGYHKTLINHSIERLVKGSLVYVLLFLSLCKLLCMDVDWFQVNDPAFTLAEFYVLIY